MRKLLASDVDGTLFVNEDVHIKSIEYIKQFREDGHIFLLCTGRNLGGVKHLINNYDIEADGFVLCNGSVVLDKNFEIIHNEKIQDKIIKKVFEESKDAQEFNFYFGDSDNIYIVDGYNSNPIISAMEIREDMTVVTIDEEEFYKNEYTANTIGVELKSGCIEKTHNKLVQLESLLGEYVSLYRNQNFIDIAPKGCSKSEGIAKVLDKYEVEDNNVYVIGDSWNDASMFEKYKNSYTFSYAEKELQKKASSVIDAFYDCFKCIL
ncbi:MAG: HAD-IIB family hydrolase [Peptostreptococcaceae bacterium]